MPPILNIAAYKFAALSNLTPLRAELLALCNTLHLKGTILLSPEGINLFLAGAPDSIHTLLTRLRSIEGLADLTPKESHSDQKPFLRMRVKIKKEIITFNVPAIDPRIYTSPRLSAEQLKQWLDEGRPLTLLDTRNNHEVHVGTFHNALPINIDDFRDFPEAAKKLPDHLKTQPIVTFCTGGIRCEKAAPFLESLGFTNVLQLDGGILKYLETQGNAHYTGHCFVFDNRNALNESLTPQPLPTPEIPNPKS